VSNPDRCPVGELRRAAADLVELIDQTPHQLLTDGRELAELIDRLLPEALAAVAAQPTATDPG
jgi:hypothetical protein